MVGVDQHMNIQSSSIYFVGNFSEAKVLTAAFGRRLNWNISQFRGQF